MNSVKAFGLVSTGVLLISLFLNLLPEIGSSNPAYIFTAEDLMWGICLFILFWGLGYLSAQGK